MSATHRRRNDDDSSSPSIDIVWDVKLILAAFSIQVVSVFARVTFLLFDLDDRKHDNLRVAIGSCLTRLDFFLFFGIVCYQIRIECRFDGSASRERKTFFSALVNLVVGSTLGNFVSWMALAGTVSLTVAPFSLEFGLISAFVVCCSMVVADTWRARRGEDDNKNDEETVEHDLERPFI